MEKFPNAEEVSQELSVIDEQIERLQARKALLLKYRELAAEVLSSTNGYKPAPAKEPISVHRNGSEISAQELKELAVQILSKHGVITTQVMLYKMRDAGWEGSGEESRDWDRIKKMLVANPAIFKKIRRGTWGLTAKAEVLA